MGQEIERKYLVDKKLWSELDKPVGVEIRQGYIDKTPEHTVRIRTKGLKGFITIKGKEVGGVRSEFEYEIPLSDADEMLDRFCDRVLHKTRFEVPFESHVWEVDVFHWPNPELVLAEVELQKVDESIPIPDWIGEEVTGKPAYYNANMI
jgi:adenylate cyclase